MTPELEREFKEACWRSAGCDASDVYKCFRDLFERIAADSARLDRLEDMAVSCRVGPLGQERELCEVGGTLREAIDNATDGRT